ncbi:MAG: hypothetical protein NT067_00575 [Candidatus Diapherotrites archaeon]|nr:hypothetical protein [Candidatus Diapherotrites archaeon]
MKKYFFGTIFLLVLLVSAPVFGDCIAGWYCKDASHRAYRAYDCSWNQEEYCAYGCMSGICTAEPNNAPSIPEVSITPDPATADNDLVCHAYSTDPEDQTIEYEYKWYRDSEYYSTRISGSQTDILQATHTSEGETWMCKVRAYDQKTYSGYGYDTATISSGQQCTSGWKCKTSSYRAYQNANCSWSNEEYCSNGCLNGFCVGSSQNHTPTNPDVYISPSSPANSEDLICHASSYDQDNNPIEYHYTWKRNGSTFRTFSTTSNTTTVDADDTEQGNEWQCTVRAFDGEDYSDYSFDTVNVGGSDCSFSTRMTPEYSSIRMARNDSRTVRVKLENNSCEDYCVDLYGRDSSSYIDASSSAGSVCLNEGESTWVSLNIETIDASAGTYTAKLEAQNGSSKATATISVIVESCSSCGDDCDSCTNCNGSCSNCGSCDSSSNCLSLSSASKNVCRGQTNTISVLVRNTSNEIKEIELEASSSTYLATFEESNIELDAHSQEYVELEIYAYPDASLGSHYVNVSARTDDDYEQVKAYFTVKDCEATATQSFSLSMSGTCTALDKGTDKNISFTVKNNTSSDLTVYLQAVADIPTEVQASIDLGPHQSKILKLKASARADEGTGKHYVKLYAWAGNYRVYKDACFEVGKKRKTDISLKDNNISIEQCSNSVFVLLLENKGDYNETYSIELSNSTRAKITLSDKNISILAGKGKEVFINVDVPLDMAEGTYWFDLVVKGKETFRKRLYFDVVKAPEKTAATVEIATYPSKIVLFQGEEKTVSVSLANLSSEAISGIKVSWEMPQGIEAENATVDLESKEAAAFEFNVLADEDIEPGTYYGTLSMKVDDKEASKKITIVITTPEQAAPAEEGEGQTEEGEGLAPLAVLASLGQPLGIGLIILLMLVIVMVALKGFIESDVDHSKPVWHRR